ncbi:hypothetical protein [Rubritalea tangerina]|uniref:hypothetical protein n=1 Tax=Rubritalea tangerina TaxID=430798 RepID=UPI0036185306
MVGAGELDGFVAIGGYFNFKRIAEESCRMSIFSTLSSTMRMQVFEASCIGCKMDED